MVHAIAPHHERANALLDWIHDVVVSGSYMNPIHQHESGIPIAAPGLRALEPVPEHEEKAKLRCGQPPDNMRNDPCDNLCNWMLDLPSRRLFLQPDVFV